MKPSIFIFLATLLALSACNTMEGVGKDVKRAGESIEDAARQA